MNLGDVVRIPELAWVGQMDPDFRVIGVFGGGMGVCYQLESAQSRSLIALKGIRPDLPQDEHMVRRFEQEVLIWITLSRLDGIVPAIGLIRWNDQPFVAATWMRGGELGPRMSSLEPQACLPIILEVLHALERVWTRYGVVHRDIKPSNILFDERGRAHLSDWGLAGGLAARQGVITDRDDLRVTLAGGMGTVLYAAPEQILDASTVDWRADLFALGVVLYEWETGAPPFLGANADEVVRAKLGSAPAPLRENGGEGRLGLGQITMRCLRLSPEERWPSYRAVIDAVRTVALRQGLSVPAMPIAASEEHIVRGHGPHVLREMKEVEADLAKAQALIHLERFAEAEPLLSAFYMPEVLGGPLQLPAHLAAAMSYAQCLIHTNPLDQSKASKVFERLREAGQRPVEWYLNYSYSRLWAGDFRGAEQIAQEGLTSFPDEADLVGNLMQSLCRAGLADEALPYSRARLRSGISITGAIDCVDVLLGCADSNEENWPLATSHLHRAEALLEEALLLNADHAGIRLRRAEVRRRLFRYPEALEDAAASSNAARNSAERLAASSTYANILALAGPAAAAVEWINAALASCSTEPWRTRLGRARAHAFMGLIHSDKDGNPILDTPGDDVPLQEVVDALGYDDVVPRDPHDVVCLARVLAWQNGAGLALATLDEAEKRWPSAWEIMLERANVLSIKGAFDGAEREARRSATHAPYRPEPLDLLAWILQAKQDTSVESVRRQAEDVFRQRKALASRPPIVRG